MEKSVGLIYVLAISLVGLLLLAVVFDAVMSVSSRQGWPDIRMNAQHAQPGFGSDRAPEQAVKDLREAPTPGQRVEPGQRVARNDEVAEAA
jgi:hypothetical protein